MIVRRPNASPVAELYRHIPLLRGDEAAREFRKDLRRLDLKDALK